MSAKNEKREPEQNSGSALAKMPLKQLHRHCVRGAKHVNGELQSLYKKIRPDLAYIAEMRARFSEQPRGQANIFGCKTWTQYVQRYLNRTDRQIRKLLSGLEPFKEEETPVTTASPPIIDVTTTTHEIKSIAYVKDHTEGPMVDGQPEAQEPEEGELKQEPEEVQELKLKPEPEQVPDARTMDGEPLNAEVEELIEQLQELYGEGKVRIQETRQFDEYEVTFRMYRENLESFVEDAKKIARSIGLIGLSGLYRKPREAHNEEII
jgi:hypothetical protein